ncbi:MAG: ribosomal protein S18-alanine N-acetyltransferase [Proteobacteria bacterium]|nr:ribosomal protein S18-alanine N-acetyltransferase [Pseudomonadota bacterium]
MIIQRRGIMHEGQQPLTDEGQEEHRYASCNNELVISKMQKGDIEKILEIEKRSFITPWTKKMLNETLSSPISISLVIKESKLLLGYIMLYSVLNEAHILNLATNPDYRRRGYASRLIRHTIEYCEKRDISEFFLEVRDSNIKAKKLYRMFGFEVIGKRKGYYTDTHEDALVMQLSLH